VLPKADLGARHLGNDVSQAYNSISAPAVVQSDVETHQSSRMQKIDKGPVEMLQVITI
jgi:hypothetical protein